MLYGGISMAEVYYYLPTDEVENAVDCGIKLSVWYNREIPLSKVPQKCLVAYLNPRDNMDKYNDPTYECIKMEIDPKYCYVSDGILFHMSKDNPHLFELYLKSILPVDKYIFGSYMLPECLVTTTVIGDYVQILNKKQDSPFLFENSEEIYLKNIIETNRDKYKDFDNTLLYYFYNGLAEISIIDRIEDREKKWVVFSNKATKGTITLRIPNLK